MFQQPGTWYCAASVLRAWRHRTRRGRLCALGAHEQCMCWHAATARRLMSLKRVSEGDETRITFSPAWFCPRPLPPPPLPDGTVGPDAGTERPKPARLSGSVGLGMDQPSPPQSWARAPRGIIIAQADMKKLLPGALRGFRPESPGSSEGSNPPSAEDAAEDAVADATGSISARTLLSGKSTARGGIDKEVLSHHSTPTTQIIFDILYRTLAQESPLYKDDLQLCVTAEDSRTSSCSSFLSPRLSSHALPRAALPLCPAF